MNGSQAFVERRFGVLLAAVLTFGLVGRVILDLKTRGVVYDLQSLQLVGNLLHAHPGTVYEVADANSTYPRWPYPPGFFPVILACRSIAFHTGLGFDTVIRFPAIVCDIVIAFVVQDLLAFRGAGRQKRLAAAALVALGPSFAAISAIHGQLDAVGIMPAVIAVALWERRIARRAVVAGALIGVGWAIKSVPAIALLALLPSVDSRREALSLITSAAAVMLMTAAPYLAHDGVHWVRYLSYNGGIGLGSLSLVAQPDLALNWLHVGQHPISSFSFHLRDASRAIAGIAVLGAFAVVWRGRLRASLAATILFLTVYAFGVTFFMQYMVWGLPFMLMAGYVWQVLALEALLLAPVYAIYHGVTSGTAGSVLYIVPMLAVWVLLTASLAWLARASVLRRPIAV